MTGVFDGSKLAYSPDLEIEEGIRGGLYFDTNQSGVLNPPTDYIVGYQYYNGICYYSEWLREAAELLGITYPDHIPSVEETADFWHFRNGEYWIQDAVEKNPNLMFIVEAGDTDHVQEAPDHPHVLVQYMGFLDAGARFTRLNPDRYYVNQVMGIEIPGVVDNDGMISYNHLSIRDALQPRNIPVLSGEKSTIAAVCELADRTRDDNVEPQIYGATGLIFSVMDEVADKLHVYPNPTAGNTTLSFELATEDEVSLIIYSTTGERISTVFQGVLSPGEHQVIWNGFNSPGQKLSPGLYYIALISSAQKDVRSIILVR